jgi:hypothetical protein
MSDHFTQHDDDGHDLLAVEEMLRSLTVDDLDAPAPPPARIWAAIQSDLVASGDLGAAAPAPPAASVADPEPQRVASMAEHRARRGAAGRPFLLAAAAVVVMVVGAVVVVATRGGESEVLASATLTWDPAAFDPLGADARARAELVQGDDGYELVITDAQLPADVEENADLELWLISLDADGNPADVQPVSLVDPTAPGTYAVPAELDPDTYTVVDISIEPRDGDDAHSGRSILRGQLSA